MKDNAQHKPRFGIQGTVIGWQDPWAQDASDLYMRTGTGAIIASQDLTPPPAHFIAALQDLKADFYIHHVFPNLEGQEQLLQDARDNGIDLVLGNEYGNINGPWIEGTNRYDVPDNALLDAAASGKLIGLLYDEPEHLQINVSQYREDSWQPHWGAGGSISMDAARDEVTQAVASRVQHVHKQLSAAGYNAEAVPLLSEQVFPTLFHTHARGGMAPCPKIMKESFQPLQLATALGAAKQYGLPMWICADLWGPDVGPWPTRTSGFPGHSPEEFASALRMGYLQGPTHLFTENADGLLQYSADGFKKSVFGDVWKSFVIDYAAANPLTWSHLDAVADVVFIHSDDSNYGQNERPFGSQALQMPEASQSIFHVWHLLSGGVIPAHGSCLHIPGYDFPRHELKRRVPADQFPLPLGVDTAAAGGYPPASHPLFAPLPSTLVYDGFVRAEQIGRPKLILVAGSSVSAATLQDVRKLAEEGITVIVASWLLPSEWQTEQGFAGGGSWLPTEDFLSERVREATAPFTCGENRWTQRFGDTEVRIYPRDQAGYTLDFEIASVSS
ncbi:hypothetical protein BK133_23650 [Paenibacillus sp. FSL H8-0548]|uniref:hypothetical protein n=1 Tax=Paenibacillus sp. FSL H8-0548 TaxID=1920422 RepID=UPI00096CD796|nr:hypothetical protein [Paenibacillus sp. FSL H8-0548]OMF23889.1 hypothetical protein BK133_23650 [Paenibacillus sp. FSL H8-0548]